MIAYHEAKMFVSWKWILLVNNYDYDIINTLKEYNVFIFNGCYKYIHFNYF